MSNNADSLWTCFSSDWNRSKATKDGAVEIGDALKNNASDSWKTFRKAWNKSGAVDENAVEIWNSLKNTTTDLWNTFRSAWNTSGAVKAGAVKIWDMLKNPASTLWSAYSSAWNKSGAVKENAALIGNSLKNSASTLWGQYSSAWNKSGAVKENAVLIGNSLKNTASTLWNSFNSAWGTRNAVVGSTWASGANSVVKSLWNGFQSAWGTKAASVGGAWQSNVVGSLWHTFSSDWGYKSVKINAEPGTKLRLSDLVYTSSTKSLQIKSGKSVIANAKLSFAARGGIVDGATLFGGRLVAGEAGKEAIIPLERHTEWINMVARRIAELLATASFSGVREVANRLAEIPRGLDSITAAVARVGYRQPVLASGTIIPPKVLAYDTSGLSKLEESLAEIQAGLNAYRNTAQASSSGNVYNVSARVNARTLFDVIIDEGQRRRMQTGRNPFEF